MRYRVEENSVWWDVIDSLEGICVHRYSYKKIAEECCSELNKEVKPPMTPIQQKIERINDCITSMESTIAVMKKELKGLEEL